MARVGSRTWVWSGAAVVVVAIAAGVVAVRHHHRDASPTDAASAASVLLGTPDGEKRWQDLTPVEQAALEPLRASWDKLGPVRKQKWIEIAGRYATMKPAEQKRVHERIREWIAMSPEERKAVRENYARAQKRVGTQKAAQWEQYMLLPEDERQKLANAAAGKKQVAKPPTPAQSLARTPPPIRPRAQNPASMVLTPVPMPLPPAVMLPPTFSAPVPEITYPLEGAATPAVLQQHYERPLVPQVVAEPLPLPPPQSQPAPVAPPAANSSTNSSAAAPAATHAGK